jgi:hypothetical protein
MLVLAPAACCLGGLALSELISFLTTCLATNREEEHDKAVAEAAQEGKKPSAPLPGKKAKAKVQACSARRRRPRPSPSPRLRGGARGSARPLRLLCRARPATTRM